MELPNHSPKFLAPGPEQRANWNWYWEILLGKFLVFEAFEIITAVVLSYRPLAGYCIISKQGHAAPALTVATRYATLAGKKDMVFCYQKLAISNLGLQSKTVTRAYMISCLRSDSKFPTAQAQITRAHYLLHERSFRGPMVVDEGFDMSSRSPLIVNVHNVHQFSIMAMVTMIPWRKWNIEHDPSTRRILWRAYCASHPIYEVII